MSLNAMSCLVCLAAVGVVFSLMRPGHPVAPVTYMAFVFSALSAAVFGALAWAEWMTRRHEANSPWIDPHRIEHSEWRGRTR